MAGALTDGRVIAILAFDLKKTCDLPHTWSLNNAGSRNAGALKNGASIKSRGHSHRLRCLRARADAEPPGRASYFRAPYGTRSASLSRTAEDRLSNRRGSPWPAPNP